MTLCKNVGRIDRLLRACVGIVAILLAIFAFDVTSGAWLGVVVAAFGGIMLVTALAATCPLYMPFKLSTCKRGAG